jgi:hypothetical protein
MCKYKQNLSILVLNRQGSASKFFWNKNDVFAKYADVKSRYIMGLIELSGFALSSKNFTPSCFPSFQFKEWIFQDKKVKFSLFLTN